MSDSTSKYVIEVRNMIGDDTLSKSRCIFANIDSATHWLRHQAAALMNERAQRIEVSIVLSINSAEGKSCAI